MNKFITILVMTLFLALIGCDDNGIVSPVTEDTQITITDSILADVESKGCTLGAFDVGDEITAAEFIELNPNVIEFTGDTLVYDATMCGTLELSSSSDGTSSSSDEKVTSDVIVGEAIPDGYTIYLNIEQQADDAIHIVQNSYVQSIVTITAASTDYSDIASLDGFHLVADRAPLVEAAQYSPNRADIDYIGLKIASSLVMTETDTTMDEVSFYVHTIKDTISTDVSLRLLTTTGHTYVYDTRLEYVDAADLPSSSAKFTIPLDKITENVQNVTNVGMAALDGVTINAIELRFTDTANTELNFTLSATIVH
jgi:hypothetical protein